MRVNKLTAGETVRALGAPGILGITLLVFAASFVFSALLPARMARDQAKIEVAQARQPGAQARAVAQAEETPAARLRTFYAAFPTRTEAPGWLQKIFDAAAEEKLELARGEYALTVDQKSELAKYRIQLPVVGTYPQIRGFIARSLQDVPYLALEDVDFQRERAGDSQVQAKVRMTLYLVRR